MLKQMTKLKSLIVTLLPIHLIFHASLAKSSSRIVDTSNMHTFKNLQFTQKDGQKIIPKEEPKNYKEAIEESCWIEAMQEEIHEFERLEGKDQEEYILQSINEGPFKMGQCRDDIASGTNGLYLGPKRDRVVADLSQAKKERLRADIHAMNILLRGMPIDIYKLINHNTDAKDIWDNVNMLLEGYELTKDDHKSQLYDEFEHFGQHKGENIHDYYVRSSKEFNHDQLYAYLKQHELHVNENKMLMERLNQHLHDPLTLMSNVSPYQYPSSSSVHPQSSYIPPVTYQPPFTDNIKRDIGFSPADELLDNLTKQVERQNRVQGNNAKGAVAARNRGAYNRADLDEEQLLFLAGRQTNTFDDDVDRGPVQDMAQNEDNIF
uniref:Integrase, catalytic region, zinc finger, CCHC-type, peptidase aspartic, catalytic n=1 Tax=Tanacetum cinerariifolium TaxID=118510 RepID=A0A699IKL4_TANCI|nr:hypothetical protein [Tanacetum cinerariifolium]